MNHEDPEVIILGKKHLLSTSLSSCEGRDDKLRMKPVYALHRTELRQEISLLITRSNLIVNIEVIKIIFLSLFFRKVKTLSSMFLSRLVQFQRRHLVKSGKFYGFI